MKNFIILLICICTYSLQTKAQCPAVLTANAVLLPANCPSNGQATINTNAPAVLPLTYTLLTGPAGATLNVPQNSKVFNSLLAGSYTVKAACSNGTNVTIPFTISNTYNPISSINATVTTSCSTFAPSGTVNITGVTGGTAPLQYSIYKSTNANYADALSTYNSSTTKNVTSYGTYQIRVKDACNQFYTKSIDVQPTLPPVKLETYFVDNNQPCATPSNIQVYFSVLNAITNENYDIANYTASGGIKVNVYEKAAASCAPTGALLLNQTIVNENFILPLVASNNYYIETITPCGDTTRFCQDITYFTTPDAAVSTLISGCASNVPTPLRQTIISEYLSFMNYPVTAVVKNSGGTTVHTQTMADYTQNLLVNNLPLGDYTVQFTDKCGLIVNNTVINPSTTGAPWLSINYEGLGDCNFGAANQNQIGTESVSVYVYGYAQGLKEATVKILSGPSNVGISGINNPIGTNQYYWTNMLPGNYVVRVASPCANYDLPLIIGNSYLQAESIAITASTSCGGTGSVSATATYNGPYVVEYVLTNASNGAELQTNINGGFVNLPAGNYYVKLKKTNYCDNNVTYLNSNSVTIISSSAPPAITKKIGVACEDSGGTPLTTGNAYIDIAGAAPLILEYKLASSSTWINYSNNAASSVEISGLTVSAIYDIRVTSCGKTTATQVTIEPIQALTTSSSTFPCNNSPFTLSAPLIPGASYEWRNSSNAIVSSTNDYNITNYNPSYDGTYVCKVSFGVCVSRNIIASISSASCAVLPIVVDNFEIQKQQCDIVLNWKVSNANNFNLFEVEKSIDGIKFDKVKTVLFTNNLSEYSFTDNNANIGLNYYRLKLVDNNGYYKYSDAQKINSSCTSSLDVNVYPTPANSVVNIALTNNHEQNNIILLDIAGKVILKVKQNNNSLQQIDVSKIADGTYFIQVVSQKQRITKKLIIKH